MEAAYLMTMLQTEPFAMNITHSQVDYIVEILATVGFSNEYNLLQDNIMKRSNYRFSGNLSYSEPFKKIQLLVESDRQGNIVNMKVSNYGSSNENETKIEKANLELSLLFS